MDKEISNKAFMRGSTTRTIIREFETSLFAEANYIKHIELKTEKGTRTHVFKEPECHIISGDALVLIWRLRN